LPPNFPSRRALTSYSASLILNLDERDLPIIFTTLENNTPRPDLQTYVLCVLAWALGMRLSLYVKSSSRFKLQNLGNYASLKHCGPIVLKEVVYFRYKDGIAIQSTFRYKKGDTISQLMSNDRGKTFTLLPMPQELFHLDLSLLLFALATRRYLFTDSPQTSIGTRMTSGQMVLPG
jgi:hypothetical protein